MDEVMLEPLPEKEVSELKGEDLTSVADVKIPEAVAVATAGDLTKALDLLLAFEKQARVAADPASSGRVLITIVTCCYDAKNYKLLNENIIMLCKRRGQLKAAITKMINHCMGYVDEIGDMDTKLEYIKTLREVTDGKIYVEVPRARLTMTLAKIKEGLGEINEAADVLQELQVETFGSMERKEKVEFILEQVRLCMAKKDFIRTAIISKKISTRTLDTENYQDEKIRFYKLMVELAENDEVYLDICKHHLAMYNTKKVQEDDEQKNENLKMAIAHLVLSPYDNEHSDLVHRLSIDKNINSIPVFKELLQSFITKEVLDWGAFEENFVPEFKKSGCYNMAYDKKLSVLKQRAVEHNIRVIASYYTRISVKRMNELLGLPVEEAEKAVADLVVNKMIYAKIDRPAGVINFTKQKAANDTLNSWANNVNELMSLVENSTHLINLARTDAAAAKVRS